MAMMDNKEKVSRIRAGMFTLTMQRKGNKEIWKHEKYPTRRTAVAMVKSGVVEA